MDSQDYMKPMLQLARETVSAFNILVISGVCNDDECDMLRSSIMTGIILTGRETAIKNHIARLTGVREFNSASKKDLPMVPFQLANEKPNETIILGEELAQVLNLAANRRVTDILVPHDAKNTAMSDVLHKMNAPRLAELFMPAIN